MPPLKRPKQRRKRGRYARREVLQNTASSRLIYLVDPDGSPLTDPDGSYLVEAV